MFTQVPGDQAAAGARALASSRVDSSPCGPEQEADVPLMTRRQRYRATPSTAPRTIAAMAIAGAVIGFGALGMAAHATADPVPPPGPEVPVPPGQLVPEAPGSEVVAAPAPPPVGPPPVPEIANPVYGSGHSDGPLGFLRDAWHQAQDPYGFAGTPPGQMPGGAPPPPGAGPAPKLPPGYISLTAPESNGPPATGSYGGGPPLPEGYYPLNGPPPPGYLDAPPGPDAAAPPPTP